MIKKKKKKKKKKNWKVVRHFVKDNCTSSSVPPLNSFPVTGQNEFCFSPEDKAELLNNILSLSPLLMMKLWLCLPSNINVKIDYLVIHVQHMKLHLSSIF